MKNDEFAFFNHQLAGMLRDGLPLEGALSRLRQEMRHGTLRTELELLEGDLAKGVPLGEAIRARQLPELYQRMLLVGVKSNDLPAILILLGDYYQRRHNIWTRLKGLMVYPAIVLVMAFLVSCCIAVLLGAMVRSTFQVLDSHFPPSIWINLWTPPVVLGLAIVLFVVIVSMPGTRRFFRWRVPAFRESSLAQVAAAMALMLKSGVPLNDALALMEQVEDGTIAGEEIARWRSRLASGQGMFSEMASGGRAFPPLFVWLVAQSGNDLADGFRRTAEIYQNRTTYRADLLLYSALPCSVILLGMLLISQITPAFLAMSMFLRSIGGDGSD